MAAEKENEQVDERTHLLEKYGGLFQRYKTSRVDVTLTIDALLKNVRQLPDRTFSDLERSGLESALERLKIELDPMKQLQGLGAYEQNMRAHYVESLMVEMTGGKYNGPKDRKMKREQAARVFDIMAGYAKEEEE